MKREMTTQAIREVGLLIEPVLDEMQIELVDVEYLCESGRWILRVYVDRHGGITLDDCARVSREIGDLIDVKDLFHQSYILEVSSPGLNRRLRKESDFIRAVGKNVRIKMDLPVEGRRNFRGKLMSFKDSVLCLEAEDDLFLLPYHHIQKANLVYEFGNK